MFFDNGADIIVGAHPHVVQPMIYQPSDSLNEERILVYSTGNFVSNQRTAPRDGGAMFNLTMVKDSTGVRIDETRYLLTWVWLPILEGKRRYYVLPADKYEVDRGMVDVWSQNKMKAYIKTVRKVFGDNNKGVGEYRFENQNWGLKFEIE